MFGFGPSLAARVWRPVWVSLVVAFLSTFLYFNLAETTVVAPVPPPTRSGAAGTLGGLPGWAFPASFLLFLFGTTLFLTLTRRWVRLYNRSVLLMNEGRLDEAAATFQAAAAAAQHPVHRALARFSLGVTHLHRCDLDAALEVLEPLEREGALKGLVLTHEALPNLVATVHALRGDLLLAKRWLQLGLLRKGEGPPSFSLVPEAIVLCREGHFGAALKLLDSRWQELEIGGGIYLRLGRLTLAYALSQIDDGHGDEVQSHLAALAPMPTREAEAVTKDWPQLQVFLSAQGLAAA